MTKSSKHGANYVANGSEDKQIYCFKSNYSISTGAALLNQAAEALGEDQSTNNPFIFSPDVSQSYQI